MKRFARWFCFNLTIVMTVGFLGGCGVSPIPGKSNPTTQPTEETTSSEATAIETTAAEKNPIYDEVNAQYEEFMDESLGFLLEQLKLTKDYPIVSIVTKDRETILSKDEYLTAVVDVLNCEEEWQLSANAEVKVRGNSTADQGDEKPYRIRFDQKQPMLGMNEGKAFKSWVLLRAYWNLVPDYLGFSLARCLFEGEYYCSDARYVNLYINGESRGIYLLCEQSQAAKGRFGVHEPKGDAKEDVMVGYLLEQDNYPNSEEHYYFHIDPDQWEVTDITGTTRELGRKNYSVRSDIYTDEQKNFIKKYVTGVFTILYQASLGNAMKFDNQYNVVSAEGEFESAYEAAATVMDMKSLANMSILEELVHNYDVGAGSIYMAVDFSEDSDYPKLTFCGPWDFNWAYDGDTNDAYYAVTFQKMMDWGDNSNYWYILAMNIPEFQSLVSQRWQEVGADNLRRVCDAVVADIYTLENDLGQEFSWKIGCGEGTVDFVRGRIKWLDSVWGSNEG